MKVSLYWWLVSSGCCILIAFGGISAANDQYWGSKEERKALILEAITEAKISAEAKETPVSAAFNFDHYPAASSSMSSVYLLAKGFKQPSVQDIKHYKGRLLMEDMVHRAERKLMELKRKLDGNLNLKTKARDLAQELFHRPGSLLTKEELETIYPETGCQDVTPYPRCRTIFAFRYRTYNGTCNNLRRRLNGAASVPFRRILPADYEDGISAMRGRRQALGSEYSMFSAGPFDWIKPSARLVSQQVVLDTPQPNQDLLTHIVMQWGQFLDHDMGLSPEPHDPIKCPDCSIDEVCEPIRIPANDPTFGGGLGTTVDGQCLSFRRSIPACLYPRRGKFPPREQVNALTSFIDGSQIYGSSIEKSNSLRNFSSPDGQMLVGEGNLLPGDPFMAGDIRTNEQMGLTAMHTLWVREHNRIASQLKVINPHWSSNRTHEETRKIVIALLQKITYEDYLEVVLGRDIYDYLIGPYTGYKRQVDPTVPNSFATAAYRYGHSLVQEIFDCYTSDQYENGPNSRVNLTQSFFNRTNFISQGMDAIFRGLITQGTRQMDEFLNGVLTKQLFAVNGSGMDLASLNIQRQRDHGMPSFGVWKSFCQKIYPQLYENYTGIANQMTLIKLLQVYGSLETVDLWVGGISESALPGSVIGPTFACIFGLTFSNVRDGDRFWYERRSMFTPQQQSTISLTTLASVICANTGIGRLQRNVFQKDPDNRIQCTNIPSLDLSHWTEQECHIRLIAANTDAEGIDMKVTYTNHDGIPTVLTNNFLLSTNQPTCVPIECPSSLNDEKIVIVPNRISDRNRCNLSVNSRLPVDNATSDPSRYRGFDFGENHINQRTGIFRSLPRCLRRNLGQPAISVTCTPPSSAAAPSGTSSQVSAKSGTSSRVSGRSDERNDIEKESEKYDCNYSSEINGCELSQEEFEEQIQNLEKEEIVAETKIQNNESQTQGNRLRNEDIIAEEDKELYDELVKTLHEIN